jgi:nucleoside 2-deoxyribosyltransferase
LKRHGTIGVLARDKQYHDNLHENILTYLYGCGLGIAVFERITEEDFNPNVSLEVGYMLALQKPICYLKDETLKALHTDIIGKLYKEFDTRKPEETIPTQLTQWLSDMGLIW